MLLPLRRLARAGDAYGEPVQIAKARRALVARLLALAAAEFPGTTAPAPATTTVSARPAAKAPQGLRRLRTLSFRTPRTYAATAAGGTARSVVRAFVVAVCL